MAWTLTILGCGGWFPAYGRHTASALARRGEHAILIDAGTGVSRLVESPDLLDGVTRLDILLTHFHLDHIGGLAYLPAVARCDDTTLWGPGRWLYGTDTFELLARVSNEPFHPVPLEAQDIAVRDLPADEFELAGVRIALRRQDRHSAPTVGFRIEDELAWITDTAYDPGSSDFAAGVPLLAHEAWFPSSEPRNVEIHTSAAQAAEIAGAARAERLLLVHLPPFAADLGPLRQDVAGAGLDAVATLAEDGLRVELGTG
jgi:ribonuclease BN (tRNA processing enzyme)